MFLLLPDVDDSSTILQVLLLLRPVELHRLVVELLVWKLIMSFSLMAMNEFSFWMSLGIHSEIMRVE